MTTETDREFIESTLATDARHVSPAHIKELCNRLLASAKRIEELEAKYAQRGLLLEDRVARVAELESLVASPVTHGVSVEKISYQDILVDREAVVNRPVGECTPYTIRVDSFGEVICEQDSLGNWVKYKDHLAAMRGRDASAEGAHGLNFDLLWDAWHHVGADLSGLSWTNFASFLRKNIGATNDE